MLAYAASRPRPVERRSAPHAMLGIIAVHVGLLAAVMSAKMDLPPAIKNSPLVINLIPRQDPPPPTPRDLPSSAPQPSRLQTPVPVVPTPAVEQPALDPGPIPLPDIDEMVRPLPGPGPAIQPVPVPKPQPLRVGAQLLTRAGDLEPPYPTSKLASGEEAVLRLRLSIDPAGRVTAVDPVGRADPAFLEAARRHLVAHWRYKPATEDGRAIATTMVITLRFQLES